MKIVSLSAAVFALLVCLAPYAAQADNSSVSDQIAADGRFVVNKAVNDSYDFFTAPVLLGQALRTPVFYYTLLGAGAALGTGFALDNTVYGHFRGMSSGVGTVLEDVPTFGMLGVTAATYGWGLYTDNQRTRQFMITTSEGAAVGAAFTFAFKYGFARARPYRGNGRWAFWDNGESFVSGHATPAFALACGLSEYADNNWMVAIPAYGAATAVGVGRIGTGAHWLSDVVGSALLGIGSTEMVLYFHKQQQEHPASWQIFSASGPSGQGGGAGVSYDW
ncbi:MAG TPA: phosphatase PAP2 family protein [Candidatus Binataceae bacterium]|nr:phosphatase PAP2 family protein [Candidatus Binataceae bacterium]